MMDPKLAIGALSVAIGCVSYFLYIRNILRGKTKPDAASWFIWGLLAAIALAAQYIEGAGPGAWITGLTALVCLSIACLAYLKQKGKLTFIDKLSLFGALSAIILWALTNDPLVAVILVILAGALGFVPTFIKAFRHPEGETKATFAMNAFKFFIALYALQTVEPATWLYPAAMALMNTALAGMLFLRAF